MPHTNLATVSANIHGIQNSMDVDTLDLIIARVARMIAVGADEKDIRLCVFQQCKSEAVYFLVYRAAEILSPTMTNVCHSYTRGLSSEEEMPPTIRIKRA